MLVVTWVLIGACVVLSGWAAIRALRDKPVIFIQLIGGAVIEVGILIQMIVAGILLTGSHSIADSLTFWGYLITALLLLPGAAVWAIAERTKWSSVVLLVAALAIAAMQLRVVQLWSGG